jgi:putative membrane protein
MKNMTVPRSQGMEEQKVMDSLNQKSGRVFDKAYIGHMIDMYQKEIKYFEEAGERLTDMDLKAFASKTLPMLKKYLSQCIQIRNSLK